MTTNFSYVDRQRIHHNLKKMILTITIILSLFFLWFPKPTFAFDTGHHSDLVREVLQNEDFKETPIKIVQLENWLVDYYSQKPLASEVKTESKKLHFDNLFTNDNIENYWMWLTLNTKNAVEQATKKKDSLNLLTILGVSLHAVQDFYSHSNWVESHSSLSDTKSYSSATWFDFPLADRNQLQLYTGYTKDFNSKLSSEAKQPHGIYNNGMNKDSYVCDNWEQAYVFAYAASRQWVNAVHKWVDGVDSTFWSKVQNYSADEKALDEDLKASYEISLLAKNRIDGNNGHWKGSGSGDTIAFGRKALSWSTTTSLFVEEFNKLDSSLSPLVKGLKSDGTKINPPPITLDAQLTVPNVPLNQKAIIVKTEQVEKTKSSSWSSPSFYGKITVNGQTFIEAMQRGKAKISPTWTTIKFIPLETTQVPIIYTLWDQKFRFPPRSDHNVHFDINPTEKTYDLDFKFDVSLNENTGDITEMYDGPEKVATSKGSAENSAKIKFYVTKRSLSNAGVAEQFH